MTIQLNPAQHAILTHAIDCNNGKITWFPDNIKGGARQKVLGGLFNRALITSNGVDYFVAAEGYDALGCPRSTACSIAPDPELDAAVAQAEGSWTQEVQTNESAPTDHTQTDEIAIETETQVDQIDNATGCDEPVAGTDAPALVIDAPQAQPLPTTAPSKAAAEQPLAKAVRTREHSKQATILGMLKRAEGATIAQICEATGWQPHTVRGTFAGAFKRKLGLTITSAKPDGGQRSYHVA